VEKLQNQTDIQTEAIETIYINEFTFTIGDHIIGGRNRQPITLAEVSVVVGEDTIVVARFVHRNDARRAISERYLEYGEVAYASI
jgi:hypothetical protein